MASLSLSLKAFLSTRGKGTRAESSLGLGILRDPHPTQSCQDVSSPAQLSRQSFHLPPLIPSTSKSLPEHPPCIFLSQRRVLGSGVV